MDKKITIILSCFILIINQSKSQNSQHVWDSIKNITMPIVAPAFQNQFNAPYKQPLADYGWEDGLEISRDGLNLYALYSPMDFLSWQMFFTANLQLLPLCDLFGNMSYNRPYANTYGMDLVTNTIGCDSFAANIDILYSHRNSQSDSFSTWQLSGIARANAIEGGPSPLFSETNANVVDLFMFTGNGDIWMINNTTANPSGINNANRLPTPINPDSNEFNADNAFIARVNGDTIILIYEKYTDPGLRVFMYTLSSNLGVTWNTPQTITTITNSLGHIEHPFLYKDNINQWWLYFSIDYSSIVRAKQNSIDNWDSWDTPEVIISKGNALSMGEPTVTQNGDISFSLAYINTVIVDSTDVYDLDPWFLPHKPTATTISDNNSNYDYLKLNVYPNPFSKEINIEFRLSQECLVTIEIVNILGETMQILALNEKKNAGVNTIKYNNERLPSGVYICKIKAGNYLTNKTIVKGEF